MQCEVSRSSGFDPTGEWAVECGADGEYCAVCEMVVCAHCHRNVATDLKHLGKKSPAAVKVEQDQRKTG
jgi:hypothetical protein